MKNLLFLTVLVVSTSACEEIKPEADAVTNTTIILHDRSESVIIDSNHVKKFVQNTVQERMQSPENVIYRLPVGESGFDISRVSSYKLNMSVSNQTDLGGLSKRHKAKEFPRELQIAQSQIIERLNTELLTPGVESRTAILGSLAAAYHIILENQGSNIELILFSDLIEAGDIRSFYREGFESIVAAKEAANTDVEQLRVKYGLNDETFRSVQKVLVVYPSCSVIAAQSENGFILEYWSVIFTSLGGPRLKVEMSCS